MKTVNLIRSIVVGCILLQLALSSLHAEEHGHAHHEHEEKQQQESQYEHHGGEREEGVISLSLEQVDAAGIKVTPIVLAEVPNTINAPARVVFNRYKTVSITPRITSQLVKRHIALGDSVKKGQAVATLSSVEMAEAQGKLLLNYREWLRVKKLGPNIVTGKRYTRAKIDWQLAKARAVAYGMTERQVTSFVKTEDFSKANGLFVLTSPIDGTVLEEEHIKGQQVESGEEINLITDESSLWVIANVSPKLAHHIAVGNSASVKVDGHVFPAKVMQISHSVNEVTRTNEVRLIVQNEHDDLHSGLFVDAQIQLDNESNEKALTVPDSALLRSADGDWQVMVEQADSTEFKGVEVRVKQLMNGVAVIEGLEAGTLVVTEGAFFVQSELAKGNFEVHNH